MHFGAQLITRPDLAYPGANGPQIYLEKNRAPTDYYSLNGDSNAPVIWNSFTGYLNGTPPPGMVYKFTNKYSDINDLSENSVFEIYPNPCKDHINIRMKNEVYDVNVRLMNLYGQVVYERSFDKMSSIDLDLSVYNDHVYFVNVQSGKFNIVKKIVRE
jgi:hypothetical protein